MSKRKTITTVPFGLDVRIKTAREMRGWTQTELAKMVGVSKSAVNQWENGAVQNLKLGNLFAVATALQKDVRELVFNEKAALIIAEQPAKYSSFSPQQLAWLQAYESLPKGIRGHLRGLMGALAAASTDKETV